jgi:hypothetical protein
MATVNYAGDYFGNTFQMKYEGIAPPITPGTEGIFKGNNPIIVSSDTLENACRSLRLKLDELGWHDFRIYYGVRQGTYQDTLIDGEGGLQVWLEEGTNPGDYKLNCSDASARIYYDIDETTDPTLDSTIFVPGTSPDIALTTGQKIRAIAITADMKLVSSVFSKTITA